MASFRKCYSSCLCQCGRDQEEEAVHDWKVRKPWMLKKCKKHASSVQRKQKILDDLRFFLKLSCDIGIGNCDCKKKNLLLVDYCPAYTVLENLENIKLVFLPANTTSVLQHMDQGVIRSLKCLFANWYYWGWSSALRRSREHTVTLLDAVRCVEKAWRRVTEKTIRNRFRHAGIS
jgi:hypothetical protein